jgi:hypothetical protein
MKRFVYIFFCCLPFGGLAQADSSANLAVDRMRSFSLVFNRGLMITGGRRDSVPINGSSSGSYFIGGGIKFALIGKTLGLRATPGIQLWQINYDQTSRKTFPTVPDSLPFQLTREKHVLTLPTLALSLYLNLTHDEDGDSRIFAEAGGYVGYATGIRYHQGYVDGNLQRVDIRVRDLENIPDEFKRLHYGLFGRFGFKWASLYYGMRLTDIFDEFTNPDRLPRQVAGYRNPPIPPMELGMSIFF